MMPMVMPFNLKNQKDIVGLSIGDSVHFDFFWADTMTYAKNFRIVGKGTLPEDDDGFFDDEYSMKSIGQLWITLPYWIWTVHGFNYPIQMGDTGLYHSSSLDAPCPICARR